MLPHPTSAPQPADVQCTRIGVGIDTSRYGHYAAFLRHDLHSAAAELSFVESAAGYAQLRARLEQIALRHGPVHFCVRLDAAGPYADNLLYFLHNLGTPPSDGTALATATFSISCGDPQRNKNYRAAFFGAHKSDPIEARAAARYALQERPALVPVLSAELRSVRQVASRLQAVVRQRTRLVNQLHHLLTLAFPELALLVKDISAGWVLELINRFPTAQRLAAAAANDLDDIPYLPHEQIAPLLTHARCSIASLQDDSMAELLRDQVRQLRDVHARQKRLENTLVAAYRRLPEPNYLDTIPGFGPVTAAILTAFILDIERFATVNQLVNYFGAMPVEASSGVERDGRPRNPRRYRMSPRGNDLVRRYLWMAALSAVRCNPAVQPLYRRVVAKHPEEKAIAIGHAMRKLLHLVFALWKTNKPFDPKHYSWDTPAHRESQVPQTPADQAAAAPTKQAAGLKRSAKPARKEVTAACTNGVPEEQPLDGRFIDFQHIKQQLPLLRLLDHLGLTARLRGTSSQRRGPCPIHRGDGRGRTFSVNLDDNVFHCFDTACQQQGDVIDLWAALHQLPLRAAAVDLVHTFALEPAPHRRTEKRHG